MAVRVDDAQLPAVAPRAVLDHLVDGFRSRPTAIQQAQSVAVRPVWPCGLATGMVAFPAWLGAGEEVAATDAWLLLAAIGFAVVTGVNDGGALLSVGLCVRSIRPAVALLVLTAAVGIAPVLLGTAVATTLASRLVALDADGGDLALLVAVVSALAVTAALSRRGLPTSLTLAIVGAITGAGVGFDLSVSVGMVLFVLVLAAIAPIVGLGIASALAIAGTIVPASAPLHRRIRRLHWLGFGLQCVAYGANDGQKMLAILAVATGAVLQGQVAVIGWQLVVVVLAFAVGTLLGLPRFVRTLGRGVVPVRPPDAVMTEVASSTVVLGSAAVGVPVSMTQAISGALIGAGAGRGYGRVRWREVARILAAWVVTLPASAGSAALIAWVVDHLVA